MNLLIVDTNVVLSALLALHVESPSLRIIRAILDAKLWTLLSPALLEEYGRTLTRPDIARRHERSLAQVDRFLLDFIKVSVMVHPGDATPAPDPADQHLWDLLAAEPEAILVTGDRKLLASDDFPNRIVSPRKFVERYRF